jgi:Holliday junction resolvase RusA-like endonuclease
MPAVYTIPVMPPSANALTFNKAEGGRAHTAKYTKWIRDARWALLAQRARPVAGLVRITIEVSRSSGADLDNIAKPAIDLLVAHGILEDDRQAFVDEVRLKWADDVEALRITIRPATAKAEAA